MVSAFRVEDGKRLIQSDLVVLPGSSGGPLLNEKGQVVGLAQSGVVIGVMAGIGLNYFVPIEDAWSALQVNPKVTEVTLQELLGGIVRRGEAPPDVPGTPTSEVEEKIRLIRELQQKGLISKDEAELRRKEVLDRAFR